MHANHLQELSLFVHRIGRAVLVLCCLSLGSAWILSIAVGLIAWAQAVAARQQLAWALRSGAVFAGLWSVEATRTTYVHAKSVADVDARVAEAAMRGEWTLIDFYADWCVSCHVIERNVFGDPAVAARLACMQIVRPDVTRNDVADQALLERWNVMGPTTLITVEPDGTERRDLRVVGEIGARGFLERLDAAGVS
ncbi:hypothetical protein CR155_09100 [Pollutimonas nitritireducens]|uniref:Thioredoxin domain-containing protein n=1 Tax=Pollutimonas nitritireducens TaxID=2045209 RepID=A0A2N4UGX1_9BURK|nr:hypothetical protein CR155_09100 [Pollutimonas nitritireducens]